MSCLELDKSIKAVQRFIKINQRREFVPVEHLYASEWRLDGHYFPSVYAAAAHARSAQFAASREIAHDWQTRQVAEGIRWWTADRPDIEQFDANHPWVREYNGLRRLWHAGIHPTAIRRLRELLGSPPTALGVRLHRRRLQRLAATFPTQQVGCPRRREAYSSSPCWICGAYRHDSVSERRQ